MTTQSEAHPSSHKTLLWIVAVGFFMETLDSTIVNTALPAMAKSLGVSPLSMHAVITAYSLTLAMLIPASGWIADYFSIRRTFLTAICIFSIGSILCALSTNLPLLVVSRVIQGIGGSMLIPVGRLAILRVFPKDEFLAAMSFVAVPALIGPLIGPPLGGFLVEFANWHWIFLINVPVGILGLYTTLRFMPEITTYKVAHFDFKGFLFLAVMMVSISLALEGVSDFGFQQATVMSLVMLGLSMLAAFVLHANRYPRSLFSLTIFRTPSFTIGLIGNLFARIGSSAMPFLIPLLLQISMGYTALQAGSAMIPLALAAVTLRRFAPPLIMRIGYRRFLVVNTLLVGSMIASFALVSPQEPEWIRIIQLIIFGSVNSLQFSAMNSLTLKDLRGHESASGNSLLSMTQMLALSFGVANAGAILSTFSRYYNEHQVPAIRAFQATFLCLGLITSLSAFVFAQLRKTARNDTESSPEELM